MIMENQSNGAQATKEGVRVYGDWVCEQSESYEE